MTVLLLAFGGCGKQPVSIEISTPKLAADRLKGVTPGANLFFTRPALIALKEKGPADLEKRAAGYEAVLQNPKAWRELDRRERFSAVLLTGDPAGFRSLLEHLHKSPDWTLTWLDHTSYLFERAPAVAWTAAALDDLKAVFASHTPDEQVTMRVQAAQRLIAIGEREAAEALLKEAAALDANSAAVWAASASLHAACGRWDKAAEAADRALAVDARYWPAVATKADALYAFGRFSEALTLTRKLAGATPEDGQNLALHARVAHAAHAYREEIEVLEKIIAMSQSRALPTGSWRVFLAQAYAADGRPEDALAQFQAALKEPELPPQEKSFAEKGIERIQSRMAVF